MALNIININSVDYYLSSNLYEYDPAFFGKIVRRSDVLKRIKINQTDYIYASPRLDSDFSQN